MSRVKELLKIGKLSDARKLLRSFINITYQIARKTIIALRERKISYIVAPYEADAQIVHLVNAGIADFAITEDQDLVLFGCERILFKFNRKTKSGLYFENKKIRTELSNLDMLRKLCIISGCDYLPNLRGIGIKKAKKFISLVKWSNQKEWETKLKLIPDILNMKFVVSDLYVEKFTQAENTFLHQLVYCPIKKELIPLTPYKLGYTADDYLYAGTMLEKEFAFKLSIGNVNVFTTEVVDDMYCPNNEFFIQREDTQKTFKSQGEYQVGKCKKLCIKKIFVCLVFSNLIPLQLTLICCYIIGLKISSF